MYSIIQSTFESRLTITFPAEWEMTRKSERRFQLIALKFNEAPFSSRNNFTRNRRIGVIGVFLSLSTCGYDAGRER